MISFLPHEHFRSTQKGPRVSSDRLSEYFCRLFEKKEGTITFTGRAAITSLLKFLKLGREDEVWIVTTFDFPNVSSHVTCTIFNICKPSRVLTEKTKAIFVIHEFGVVHPELMKLRKIATDRKIPLIEDCAHTIDSKSKGVSVGVIGDYTILSFPKIYPVAFGGMLLGRRVANPMSRMEKARMESIPSVVLAQTRVWSGQAQRRRDIFKQLSSSAMESGLTVLFEINADITPWFFPLKIAKVEKTVELAASRRIDARPWYGSDIVILPCHQFLSDSDVKKIVRLIQSVK